MVALHGGLVVEWFVFFLLIGSMKIEWCLLPLLGPIHYQRSLVKVNLFLVKIKSVIGRV